MEEGLSGEVSHRGEATVARLQMENSFLMSTEAVLESKCALLASQVEAARASLSKEKNRCREAKELLSQQQETIGEQARLVEDLKHALLDKQRQLERALSERKDLELALAWQLGVTVDANKTVESLRLELAKASEAAAKLPDAELYAASLEEQTDAKQRQVEALRAEVAAATKGQESHAAVLAKERANVDEVRRALAEERHLREQLELRCRSSERLLTDTQDQARVDREAFQASLLAAQVDLRSAAQSDKQLRSELADTRSAFEDCKNELRRYILEASELARENTALRDSFVQCDELIAQRFTRMLATSSNGSKETEDPLSVLDSCDSALRQRKQRLASRTGAGKKSKSASFIL